MLNQTPPSVINTMLDRFVVKLNSIKEPPWYVKLLLIVAAGFLSSVAAWSLLAVLR